MTPNTYLKRERSFAGIFLFIVSFTIARTIRHGSILFCGGPCPVVLYPPESPWAPDVYRVGMNTVTRWINILFHFKDATMATAMIDFVSTFLGLTILCYLAVEGLGALRETLAVQKAASVDQGHRDPAGLPGTPLERSVDTASARPRDNCCRSGNG